jgi:hypothetical protein
VGANGGLDGGKTAAGRAGEGSSGVLASRGYGAALGCARACVVVVWCVPRAAWKLAVRAGRRRCVARMQRMQRMQWEMRGERAQEAGDQWGPGGGVGVVEGAGESCSWYVRTAVADGAGLRHALG